MVSTSSPVLAYDVEADSQVHESEGFKSFAQEGIIHVDPRAPPIVPRGVLERRANSSSISATSQTIIATSTIISASSMESSTPTTTTSSVASVTIITTPLPSPFDTSLGSNFTSQSCPDYFANFLSNSTFKSCVAVSLLLQNSNSFFRAERDATLLSETLDAACNAPLALCTPLLQSIAIDLISDANCGADYEQQNPLVSQAYAGLIAYAPIYRATCLRDPMTGNYCFSEAITNATAVSDAYPYYTALGLSLPKGSEPTCSQCLQDTMAIFATYASNASQPLSGTYMPCAQQIDAGCGHGFANTSVEVVASDATARSSGSTLFVSVIALAVAAFSVL